MIKPRTISFTTIETDRLKYLEERDWFLQCLEACGVDNWQGWDDACEMQDNPPND